MEVNEMVQEVLHNPKVAATVSGGTVASGLSTFLNWIPDDIGKLATLIGIVLSIVLIHNHLRAGQKLKLEIQQLEREARGDEAKRDS